MPNSVTFTVYGKPQQRGSKRAFTRQRKDGGVGVVVADMNKSSRAWMELASSAAAQAYQGTPLMSGPVVLTCEFHFARPQSHYGTGRNAGNLKESAPDSYFQQPDLSKLLRSVEDALTGVVYRDDRQICRYGAYTGKFWSDSQARAVITVSELSPVTHGGG